MTPEFAKAFGEVLDEVPNFVTDEVADIAGKSGNRRYKYLNLATILKNIKPIFARHGLHFYQDVSFTYGPDNKGMQVGTVTTIVFGYDCVETLGDYPFVITGDPQANGSAITYARRYALYAVLGIYPDKDDDGAAARDYYQEPPADQQQKEGGITPAVGQQLSSMAQQAHVNLLQLASNLRGSRINRLREITTEEAQEISNRLVTIIKENQNA